MEQTTRERLTAEAITAYNTGGTSRLRQYIDRMTGQEEIRYLERLETGVGNRNMRELTQRFWDLTPELAEDLAS